MSLKQNYKKDLFLDSLSTLKWVKLDSLSWRDIWNEKFRFPNLASINGLTSSFFNELTFIKDQEYCWNIHFLGIKHFPWEMCKYLLKVLKMRHVTAVWKKHLDYEGITSNTALWYHTMQNDFMTYLILGNELPFQNM